MLPRGPNHFLFLSFLCLKKKKHTHWSGDVTMDRFWKGIVEFLIGYVGFKRADRIPFPVGVVFAISLAWCLTLRESTWARRSMSTRSSLSERNTVIVNQAKKYLLYIGNICRFVHFVVDFNRRSFFTRSSMSFISLFLVEPSYLIGVIQTDRVRSIR